MIRIGIGGWVYEPWREVFYPTGLRQADELSFASRQVTTIEINGTFYRTQSPKAFRAWAEQTPDDFIFAVKGPRYAVNRARLAEAGESIARFFDSGVTELGTKLGPVLWQLPPTKKFDDKDLPAFLDLLPRSFAGRGIRHVLEVRHESFRSPAFVALMRSANIPIVYADSEDYPAIADLAGDFVYARLMRSAEDVPTGYCDEALDAWAARLRKWEAGNEPNDLPRVGAIGPGSSAPRNCFVYFINGAKLRAPAAAMALLKLLQMEG